MTADALSSSCHAGAARGGRLQPRSDTPPARANASYRRSSRLLCRGATASSPGQPAPDLIGKGPAKLQAPPADGSVADCNATGRNDLIHMPQAQREAEV